ncbi:hypothetical protein EI94DRAFT_1727897 [Lactarius quietus]|nr:hypothetical protein EI94DRAFT_1727897 [Lactarius quietus]
MNSEVLSVQLIQLIQLAVCAVCPAIRVNLPVITSRMAEPQVIAKSASCPCHHLIIAVRSEIQESCHISNPSGLHALNSLSYPFLAEAGPL